MDIKVLGSSGSEAPGCNLPAFLIDSFLLLDGGTISGELEPNEQSEIRCILLSHAHFDHIKGIPFLVDNMAARSNGCHVTVVSGMDVLTALRENIFNGRIWPDFTLIPNAAGPVLSYRQASPAAVFEIAGYQIAAVRVDHSVPAYGYIIESPQHGCLVYTGDTGPTELLWERMRGRKIDALIIEVSFPNELEDFAVASGHLTPSLLQQELKKLKELPTAIYVSHIKPRYREIIERQLSDIGDQRLEIVEDGMVISI